MADFTDTYEIQADTSEIARAARELEQTQAVARRAGGEFYAFAKATTAADLAVKDLAATTVIEARAIDQLVFSSDRAATATNQLNATAKAGTSGSRNWGLAINAAAQGVEDLQYSVGGAMNNLSQFAMLMGAGGLVVAGVTIAGVAINQLVRHWDDFTRLIGMGKTEEEARRMADLAAETKKAEIATKTLADQVERLQHVQPAAAVGEARGVSGAIGTVGGPRASEDVFQALVARNPAAQMQGPFREQMRKQAQEAVAAALAGNVNAAGFVRDALAAGGGMNSQLGQAMRGVIGGNAAKPLGGGGGGDGGTENIFLDAARRAKTIADLERVAEGASRTGLQFQKLGDVIEEMRTKIETANAKAMGPKLEELIGGREAQQRMDAAKRGGHGDMRDPVGLQSLARVAQEDMQSAMLDFQFAGNPAARRFFNQMQQRQARFANPNAGANIAARQMAIRAAGGQRAIAEREEAAKRFMEASKRQADASEAFQKAVQKLADGNIRIIL